MIRTVALMAPLLIGLVVPATAQDTAEGSVPAGVSQRVAQPDLAIGRFNFAGYRSKRHCTMFAIGPTTVVTAAHCLSGLDPLQTHLLFGYSQMTWAAHLSPVRGAIMGNDVAVLCLAEPAPAAIPLGAPAEVAPGDALVAVGYGAPVRHMQTRATCPVIRSGNAEGGPVLVLGCPQSHGASGGPVLDAAGQAVAVISATSRTELFAAPIPPAAAMVCADGAAPAPLGASE